MSLMDRQRGQLAVLDRLHRQVLSRRHAVAAGVDARQAVRN
jgi:hypothetical protein